MLSDYFGHLFAWFPPTLRTAFGAMLAVIVIILILKLIAAIKDIIPFA